MATRIFLRFFSFLLASFIGAACCLYAQSDNYPANYAKEPRFKALLYYSENVEEAHKQFAKDAIDFFTRLTEGDGYILETTSSLKEYDYENLKEFNTIIAVNISPSDPEERKLFEKYMENGGGWLGFHAAGYNDANTGWPWFNEFLGCGNFYCNNWPPQPALVDVDISDSPVTKNLPVSFVTPETEWYQWNPSPRENPNVEVLLSLSPKNYPFGLKDVIFYGDFPVVWRNSNYRMIYLNYGHGDRCFSDATQNLLTINAFRYVVSQSPDGDPFLK
ncbi:MAG: ThuA domain-containing protein [Muribaculaceae bacterium]|nr:ThuA domain-containing protein [Muribaculaceae bacterium]